MEIVEKVDCIIPTRYLSYLINGDHSSLTSKEVEDFDAFVEEILRVAKYNHPEGSYVWEPVGDNFFAHENDLNYIGDDCIVVNLNVLI